MQMRVWYGELVGTRCAGHPAVSGLLEMQEGKSCQVSAGCSLGR